MSKPVVSVDESSDKKPNRAQHPLPASAPPSALVLAECRLIALEIYSGGDLFELVLKHGAMREADAVPWSCCGQSLA